MDPDSVQEVARVPHGGERDEDLLDFSANTNPRTPPGIDAVLDRAMEQARAYPPEPAASFRKAAGTYLDTDPDQVIPTPGGLAAIRLAMEVTLGPGDSALVPYPSFGEYGREVRLQGATPKFVPYQTFPSADPGPHELAILCNPNNPTGELYDRQALHAFVERARATDTVVLVDEAFLGFTEQPSLSGTEGVVVARSLTKLFGLPGLRAGFAVATGDLRKRLEAARRTWNVGVPALEAGIHSMQAGEFVDETRSWVRREREKIRQALSAAYDVHPSDAPYLLLEVTGRPVDDVVASARQAGIVIRDARTFQGLDSHVRLAVKGPKANRRLEEVLLDV